jgi:hypothetical protein
MDATAYNVFGFTAAFVVVTMDHPAPFQCSANVRCRRVSVKPTTHASLGP